MGGNSSIFYGIMKMDEKPPAEQVDFTFSVFDIEGNANAIHLKIPNENDLILNQDGCFYRVISLEGEGEETVIYTKKLTIAGSGTENNNGGNGTTTKKFQLELLSPSNDSVLLGSPYAIKFKVSAVNNYGQETGNGIYRITRDNREIASGVVKQGNNEIFIENCLIEGTNKLRFNISMDVGETVPYTETLMYTIQVINMQLNWDY
jgi:hypothetical protein